VLELNVAGQTPILVTHSPNLAARCASRTVRLLNGRAATGRATADAAEEAQPLPWGQ
jgi:predicted ABC-type transport system involved in lysophospholipase L1 biosynthesis ATPase subunit